MEGFIVYSTHLTINEKTQVHLYGRLKSGESFVAVFPFQPYFYIKEKDTKKISRLTSKFKVTKTKLKTFQGEPVAKVSAQNQTLLNKLYKAIYKTTDTYEADVKPHTRFLMDQGILGSISLEGPHTGSERIDRIYQEPKIKPSEYKPDLKIVSLDIESSGDLFCIGLYSKNYKKNFMVTSQKNLKNTVSCKTEFEALEKFRQEVHDLDPDIITGWNSIDFDLHYLKKKFEEHKIPFDLGRNNTNAKIRLESNFFKASKAEIPGRQMLDALNLIRDPFVANSPEMKNLNFESYTLEDASQVILGDGKTIKGKSRHEEITALYEKQTPSSLQKLSDYNIKDCELAYKILEKKGVIDLAIERAQLTGMPLDRVAASIAAFDSLYIREAHKKGLVSPTQEYVKKEERITGGYVHSTDPGIYHNVLILDFKSLYPSIIRTLNIDPASHLKKKPSKKPYIETVNKTYFEQKDGILPEIIETLHKAREKAKKEKRNDAVYAIKIIMNSFFGVLASPNCRYFSLDLANAITKTGQFLIKLTAEEIEKLGFPVIYSDTDSVFVHSGLPKEKANQTGLSIQNKINKFYQEFIKEQYNKPSYLELEFEKQYLSMMLPAVRGSGAAAKKRYAGLIEKNKSEVLEITGLEAIRGDWTQAAQEFQKELLLKVFHKEEPKKFIKSYIKKLQSGDLDSKLVYKKSIRKALDEYTKTTPPHVKAARKLKTLDSNIIQYYITTEGPEPMQALKHKIDYKHYLDKQIKPIANQVLTLLDSNFDDLLTGSTQQKLF